MCWSIGSVIALVFWYLQGLVTPVIGALAVYIAWQQMNIASETKKAAALRSKFDLFDRRLRVLEETRKLMSIAFAKGDISIDELRHFMSATLPAEFLYGSEIREYTGEIYQHGLALWRAKEQLRGVFEGTVAGDRAKVATTIQEEMVWITEQLPVSADKFKSYLDVSKL